MTWSNISTFFSTLALISVTLTLNILHFSSNSTLLTAWSNVMESITLYFLHLAVKQEKTRVSINHGDIYHALSKYILKPTFSEVKKLYPQKTCVNFVLLMTLLLKNMRFRIIQFIFCMDTYQSDIPVLQLLACRMGHSFP